MLRDLFFEVPSLFSGQVALRSIRLSPGDGAPATVDLPTSVAPLERASFHIFRLLSSASAQDIDGHFPPFPQQGSSILSRRVWHQTVGDLPSFSMLKTLQRLFSTSRLPGIS